MGENLLPIYDKLRQDLLLQRITVEVIFSYNEVLHFHQIGFFSWDDRIGSSLVERPIDWRFYFKMLIFTILASFVCFFNFPDRNLIILYKITWKLPFCIR